MRQKNIIGGDQKKTMGKRIDLIGKRFGRLTVIEKIGLDEKKQNVLWRCKCDCGNEDIVRTSHLMDGSTRSCGCYARDVTSKRSTKHGDYKGDKPTRLYKIWYDMKSRCKYESTNGYERYGGRGITVCEEWDTDYTKFKEWALLAGYQEGLTLDRIDNNGNYCPENCRWVTMKEQARNRTTNHYITYNGETKCVTEWAEEFGIDQGLFYNRLRRGWSIEKIISTPVQSFRS